MEQSGRRPLGLGSERAHGARARNRSGPTPPDLEDLLRRGQDKLQQLLPGGNLGGKGIALILLGALAIWGLSGFFRVQPDELGVVLRFGKHVRTVQPGLNYHLPYPIETVLTPKALRVSTIDIGMRLVEDPARRGSTMRDVPEESLMLTGDENIVDVDFTVLWRIKPDGVGNYPVQHPESRRHREGGGRKRDARSDRPLRHPADPDRRPHNIEQRVQELMQKTLDTYGAGILITAGADAEGRSAGAGDRRVPRRAGGARRPRAAQNEAQTYANRVVPEARGRAAQILQAAEAYREQAVAEAKGQTARFLKVYDEYKKAPGRDAPAHLSRNHGARARRHRQDHLDDGGASGVRRRAVSAAQRTDAAASGRRRRPAAAAAGGTR